MNKELIAKLSAAPESYETPEYTTAKTVVDGQREYVKKLNAEAKGTRKNSEENKAALRAQKVLDEMNEALRQLPAPRISASWMIAQAISEMVESILSHRKNWTMIQSKMILNPVSTLGSYMDDIVNDQVVEVELLNILKSLKHVNNERGQLTIGTFNEVWEHFEKRYNDEVKMFMRKCSSRSTSAVANLIEDLTFQAKAQLYDKDSFCGYGRSTIQWTLKGGHVEYDEVRFPIDWTALDELISL